MAKRGRTDADMKMKRRKRTSRKKEADINKLINICVKTGKTIIGTNKVLNYINTNDLRVIILAQNCPNDVNAPSGLGEAGIETSIQAVTDIR